MSEAHPIYDTCDEIDWPSNSRHFGIKVVRSLNEIMQVTALRASVFMSEQACPYNEEFDGNDLSATHLIGYRGREPVACIRVRYFADFAKLERLTVRPDARNSRMSINIVWAAIALARKKGYRRIYGHAQDRLVKFWSHFGASPMTGRRKLIFSDFSYTEMLLLGEPDPNPITLQSDPYVIIRPEGAWHRSGVLEQSASRAPTTAPKKLRAA